MAMIPKVLAPGEVAPQRYLYVIERGSVMFGGRILSRGMAVRTILGGSCLLRLVCAPG